jgi:hypothetical protein
MNSKSKDERKTKRVCIQATWDTRDKLAELGHAGMSLGDVLRDLVEEKHQQLQRQQQCQKQLLSARR